MLKYGIAFNEEERVLNLLKTQIGRRDWRFGTACGVSKIEFIDGTSNLVLEVRGRFYQFLITRVMFHGNATLGLWPSEFPKDFKAKI